MTEDVFEAEAEKLMAVFFNMAALLRRRVNNITAQDNAELSALSAERRNLPGTVSIGQKNSALPPHPNQLFSSPAPNKDISRYREVSQDHLQVSGNARGGSFAEFPASAQASQPQQHLEGSSISPSPHHFHLPRAELPKFTGKLTDWPEFYRCFRAMADHQYSPPNLPNAVKVKADKRGPKSAGRCHRCGPGLGGTARLLRGPSDDDSYCYRRAPSNKAVQSLAT